MVGHLTSPSLKYKNVQCGERLHSDFFACRDLCLSNGFFCISWKVWSLKSWLDRPATGREAGQAVSLGKLWEWRRTSTTEAAITSRGSSTTAAPAACWSDEMVEKLAAVLEIHPSPGCRLLRGLY